jgi:DNA replicative helicase MCM subunit Mcm2 (Cdc46/Mcm family)
MTSSTTTNNRTRLSREAQAEVLKWPHQMDIGIFEADTRNKQVSVLNWSKMDLSKVDFAKELASGKYDNGIAIRCGKSLSGKHYIIGLDFDSWKAVVAWFGSWENVLILAEKELVEWHEDKESVHVILFSDQPLPNRKIHIGDGRVEIICEGGCLFASPSIHKEGKPYRRLGRRETPRFQEREEMLRLKSKIDLLCQNYMSDVDKEAYDKWLDQPTTILGVRDGRHDATKFKICRYYWKYRDEWLNLSDEERFRRAWQWHLKHCNPPRSMKEFDEICRWVVRTFKKQRNELHGKVRGEIYNYGKDLWHENPIPPYAEELSAKQLKDEELPTLTVSEALRILPEATKNHTKVLKVRGSISSLRPVFKMIAGEYGICPSCGERYHEIYKKPSFYYLHLMIPFCTKLDAPQHPHDQIGVEKGKGRFVDDAGNEYDFKKDSQGKIVKAHVYLNIGLEYRNATIIEIQDTEKFEEMERLEVILFGADTENVRAGEPITITGRIWIEPLKQTRDSKLSARLYSHSIKYEAKREISITNQDKDAIHRFVKRFGANTVSKLAQMFAPRVIGYEHIKEGLLFCAARCGDDHRSSKTFKRRVRMHAFLIGDPGTAKSILLREIIQVVENSRYESLQHTTGKSLTAIVSKEGSDTAILRLGPAPMAKEGILAANELGRMSYDDQSPLLDVMEEGEFSIVKYGISAKIRSPTVVIGSSNTTSASALTSDKISMDDIPAIKPLIDRFDLIFVVRTSRDPVAVRAYTLAKAKQEDAIIPNYNPYLEKHLLYAKRFNPRMSDEAQVILSHYYMSIAKRSGSPRIRETVYKIARMIARLELKTVVDGEDAKKACQFYNVDLNERDQIVSIPANPRDYTFTESLYKLEATQAPITFKELVDKACNTDEYISSYVGPNHDLEHNGKLTPILDMLLNHSQVRKIGLKPIVLQWIPKPDPLIALSDVSDLSDTKNISSTQKEGGILTPLQVDNDEKVSSHGAENAPKKVGRGSVQASDTSVTSDSDQDSDQVFDINKVQIVNIRDRRAVANSKNGPPCDILIARNWPDGLRPHPLAGMSGYLGNPFVIGKDKDGTREEVVPKYKEWLHHGTEIVNGRDPKEYRRLALKELPGHYRWGCYCKPEVCHGDILLAWLKRQLQIQKARQTYTLKSRGREKKQSQPLGKEEWLLDKESDQ